MSSSALTKLDAEALSVVTEPTVTEAQAKVAMERMGIPLENLAKWNASKTLGRFLGHEATGAIMTRTYLTSERMEKVANHLMKVIEEPDTASSEPEVIIAQAEIKMKAVSELNSLFKAYPELASLELKLVELLSMRQGKESAKENAPQLGGTRIHTELVVINGNPKQPPVEPNKLEG
jgi:hypothetical protein